MKQKRPSRGLRDRIDREIAELDRERARLAAARAALDRARPTRISQEEVARFLAEHPGSTYLEIAEELGALPRNIAAHLHRGAKAGRFHTDAGKWSLTG